MKITIVILALLFEVYCAPGLLGMDSISVPLDIPSDDKSSNSLNVGLSEDGVGLSKHSETVSENDDHDENTSNDNTNDNSEDGKHVNEVSSNTTRTTDSHHTRRQSQDTGLKLGGGGLNMFDNKKQTDDTTVIEQETGRNSTLRKDREANSAHYEASGSEYNQTTKTDDHEEKNENTSFSLGLGGGNNGFTKQSGGSQSHEKTTHKEGSSWKKTKDISRDGNKIDKSSTNQSSKYGSESTEVSSKTTQDKETKDGNEPVPRNILLLGRKRRNVASTNSEVTQDYINRLREFINSRKLNQAQDGMLAGNILNGHSAMHSGNDAIITHPSSGAIPNNHGANNNLAKAGYAHENLAHVGYTNAGNLHTGNAPIADSITYVSGYGSLRDDNFETIGSVEYTGAKPIGIVANVGITDARNMLNVANTGNLAQSGNFAEIRSLAHAGNAQNIGTFVHDNNDRTGTLTHVGNVKAGSLLHSGNSEITGSVIHAGINNAGYTHASFDRNYGSLEHENVKPIRASNSAHDGVKTIVHNDDVIHTDNIAKLNTGSFGQTGNGENAGFSNNIALAAHNAQSGTDVGVDSVPQSDNTKAISVTDTSFANAGRINEQSHANINIGAHYSNLQAITSIYDKLGHRFLFGPHYIQDRQESAKDTQNEGYNRDPEVADGFNKLLYMIKNKELDRTKDESSTLVNKYPVGIIHENTENNEKQFNRGQIFSQHVNTEQSHGPNSNARQNHLKNGNGYDQHVNGQKFYGDIHSEQFGPNRGNDGQLQGPIELMNSKNEYDHQIGIYLRTNNGNSLIDNNYNKIIKQGNFNSDIINTEYDDQNGNERKFGNIGHNDDTDGSNINRDNRNIKLYDLINDKKLYINKNANNGQSYIHINAQGIINEHGPVNEQSKNIKIIHKTGHIQDYIQDTDKITKGILTAYENGEDVVKEIKEGKFGPQKVIIVSGDTIKTQYIGANNESPTVTSSKENEKDKLVDISNDSDIKNKDLEDTKQERSNSEDRYSDNVKTDKSDKTNSENKEVSYHTKQESFRFDDRNEDFGKRKQISKSNESFEKTDLVLKKDSSDNDNEENSNDSKRESETDRDVEDVTELKIIQESDEDGSSESESHEDEQTTVDSSNNTDYCDAEEIENSEK